MIAIRVCQSDSGVSAKIASSIQAHRARVMMLINDCKPRLWSGLLDPQATTHAASPFVQLDERLRVHDNTAPRSGHPTSMAYHAMSETMKGAQTHAKDKVQENDMLGSAARAGISGRRSKNF